MAAAARPALKRALPSLRSSTFLPHQQQPHCHHHVPTSRRSLSTTPSHRNDAQPTNPSDKETHFGFSTVTTSQKRALVASVFTSVADSYDKMNDLMSFGWHRIWKDHFVSTLNPGFSPLSSTSPTSPQHILDIAGGTGDIAFRLLHHAHTVNSNPNVKVTISDINRAMLSVGKSRSAALPASQQAALSFVEANAEDLRKTRPLTPILSQTEQTFFDPATATSGLEDDSVDLYTVAFGIRNFSDIPAALAEAYRVLKPGGVFACLEFSKADKHPLFNSVYKEWSFRAIPLIGQLVAGDRDSYQYLVESIERFPRQEEFRDLIKGAGFRVSGDGGWEDLTGGVAAIHRGMKPRE
ncbi:2-hexaprenyl-6-methoxy-1,4-benzoquinone methyltransferase [Podospora pseudopauciseta]|uniref:2-methoxy-6-polyprenyl-1,4-benzoquinol methylase, mitochondrial n=1 Tax=Podospora pseudopauciseta TaxID=2093780 RepID=A0ABR0HDP0_9PEZI|nr:2-hexaprenyl-6-methoxy-1,4-benzoquinone methyltransferase [Podospora pseudopauciseta]